MARRTERQEQTFFLMMHHKAVHRNWVPAERHYHLYEHTTFPLPDNYFDVYEGRYAAQMQKMNIYCDMYEGHDLKMVTGMDSDSLLFDLGRMLFWGQWSRMNAVAFLMHTVIEIMNSTPENVHSKKLRNGNTSVICKIIWEL